MYQYRQIFFIMKQRDYSLDAIKGIACILMIFAHAKISQASLVDLHLLKTIGGFAPVLFFAVSGVTATFQASRKKILEIILFYTLFAVIGLSYNTIWEPQNNILNKIDCEIFQIIAIGAIIISLIELYIKPQKKYYLFLAITAFCIHYFYTQMINVRPSRFAHFLFCGDFTGTAFPIFPWVSIFFFGIFAYNIKNKFNLIIGIVSSICMVLLLLLLPSHESLADEKWNMSIGYFLRSSSFLFLSFYVFRKYNNYFYKNNVLIYLGQNSLLFLYVHLIFLKIIFPMIGFDNAYPVWVISLLLSLSFMKVSQYANTYIEQYFNNFYIWAIIIALICAIPLIFHVDTTIQIMQVSIGVLVANNYQNIPKLLKQLLR